MDRTAWITVVILWVTCACKLSEASGCTGRPCSDTEPCNNANHVCGDGICRKCICKPTGTCFWNSTSYRTECNCDNGYHGRVCDCKDTGCGCPDTYTFGTGCSAYSSDYERFPNKGIDFGPSAVNVTAHEYEVYNGYQCKQKCIFHGCNVYEYFIQIYGSGKLNICKVFLVGNLVEANACIKESEASLYFKRCQTCTV